VWRGHALDLHTAIWTAFTSPNGPGDPNETGTYERWRRVDEGTFLLVNGPDQNAYPFRM
jgi:hypothetical protein